MKFFSVEILKNIAILFFNKKIIKNDKKQKKAKIKNDKINKFNESLFFLGSTIANSYCNVAKGFSINVTEENNM